jgi:hypothetical protein
MDDKYAPSRCFQRCSDLPVSLYVPAEFFAPKLFVCRRQLGQITVRMLMPEAPMHEDCKLVSGQHQVRAAWQILPVKPVSKSAGE